MNTCSGCDAPLSDWEVAEVEYLGVPACWCDGVPGTVSRSLHHLAYAAMCDPAITRPVKVHDVGRLVAHRYLGNPRYQVNVALSQYRRFCWAGRSLYGLARHGLIPGPRTLAEAAYAVLLAAPRELHLEEVDFVLEQFNYRFNSDSLMHHLRGYTRNRWDLRFRMDSLHRVSVNSGRDARHAYNRDVQVCRGHSQFDSWVADVLGPRVQSALDDRVQRLAAVNGTASAMTPVPRWT